jgi:hypothetical protein
MIKNIIACQTAVVPHAESSESSPVYIYGPARRYAVLPHIADFNVNSTDELRSLIYEPGSSIDELRSLVCYDLEHTPQGSFKNGKAQVHI